MFRRIAGISVSVAAALAVVLPGTAQAGQTPGWPSGNADTAAPAAAEDQIGPTATICPNAVNDPEPRPFNVHTDVLGGQVVGFVWVQRRSDGRGYHVCVGAFEYTHPYPWQAGVRDTAADGHGAVAYVTYIPWGSSTRRYHDWKRVDGYGNHAGWNAVYTEVSGFYVGVCRIRQGVKTDCNDEGGTR